jgi:hypothetical protein
MSSDSDSDDEKYYEMKKKWFATMHKKCPSFVQEHQT